MFQELSSDKSVIPTVGEATKTQISLHFEAVLLLITKIIEYFWDYHEISFMQQPQGFHIIA